MHVPPIVRRKAVAPRHSRKPRCCLQKLCFPASLRKAFIAALCLTSELLSLHHKNEKLLRGRNPRVSPYLLYTKFIPSSSRKIKNFKKIVKLEQIFSPGKDKPFYRSNTDNIISRCISLLLHSYLPYCTYSNTLSCRIRIDMPLLPSCKSRDV